MAGYIGNNPSDSSVRIARQIYTTSGITSDFTFTSGYDSGYIDIYVNGERQTEGTNFTASDGETFTILNGGVSTGSTVEAAAYKTFNVATVTLGEVTDVDDLTVSGSISAATVIAGSAVTSNLSGINVSGAVTATSFDGDGSGLTGVASTDNITTSTPAEFQQINVSGIATIGVTTISTSVAVGAAVTVTATTIVVDPAVTTTIDGDVNFQGGNYNITRSRANSSIDFDDNAKARFGSSQDLEIYHNATNSIINDSGSGDLLLAVGGSTVEEINASGIKITGVTTSTQFKVGTAVTINSDGADIVGIVTATSFAGDGSALSGVGGDNNITSGLFL
tara:strand:+ start:710 stop:1714 length:1005 start_codon:yes stop_codon:yes gene_type:complete